jgi:uncharacterized protein
LNSDEILLRIAAALDRLAPVTKPSADLLLHPAYHWDGQAVVAIDNFAPLPLDLIVGVDRQKAAIVENCRRLANQIAAHDIVLWGARGMGKSALVKSAIVQLQGENLPIALVEAAAGQIETLPCLFALLAETDRPYLVFIDDIGFEENGLGSRFLRSMLDGGAEARPENVRLCVTSNRRNIVVRDAGRDPVSNRDAVDDELALADRFGLKLGFQYPDQAAYLDMVGTYAAHYGLEWTQPHALAFAHERGNRSGRTAWHYAVEIAGRAGRKL